MSVGTSKVNAGSHITTQTAHYFSECEGCLMLDGEGESTLCGKCRD